jgi:aryl-alcohol dehydrogenase-like predicted oxidoreductase
VRNAAHDLVEKFAKDLDATPLQVALAWLLRRSSVTLPIPGTSSPQHVEENIAAASLKLPEAAYKQLEAVTPPPASLR